MNILYGKPVADAVKKKYTAAVEKMQGRKPELMVLQYGDDAASKAYVKKIEKNCINTGIGFHYKVFKGDEISFINSLKHANENPDITSIMVQQPLPYSLKYVIDMINPEKDVEGVTTASLGKLFAGQPKFVPCTAEAVIEILEFYKLQCEGKHAVVIGRSNIVGKPVSILLQQKNATVTMCHSKTENLKEYTKQADILVAAVGRPNMITGDMIKEGAIVIDVGTNFIGNKMAGDIDFESANRVASHITPVPSGVGTVTNQILIKNIVKSVSL